MEALVQAVMQLQQIGSGLLKIKELNWLLRARKVEGSQLGFVQLYYRHLVRTLPSEGEGIYTCIISKPGTNPIPAIATFYIGIYNTGNGECMCIMVKYINHSTGSTL